MNSPVISPERPENELLTTEKRGGWGVMFVLMLASCTLLLGLGWPQLWDRDEPRNAGCTAEMLARADWVVPVFNSELRTHKPILLYWLQMAAYQIAGTNEWGARLPSALLMMGTILCAMLLSSRLLTHRFLEGATPNHDNDRSVHWYRWNSPAMWSGVVLATSLMMIVAGRASTPDSPLIFCSTLAITAFGFALTCHAEHTLLRWKYYLLGYVALGLGVLAKGPVGFALPITVVSAWFQWERICQDARFTNRDRNISLIRQWKLWLPSILARLTPRAIFDYLSNTKLLVGIPIILAVALPWYIWVGVRTDGRWLREFFWEHNVQRAVQSLEGHRGGPWYYPVAMLVGLFPWSLWLAPFLVWLWKTTPLGSLFVAQQYPSKDKHIVAQPNHLASLSRLSVMWVAVFVGAFSCANTKLPSYITPCYPGAALLVGLFFATLANSGGEWFQSYANPLLQIKLMRYAVSATLLTALLGGIGATIGLAIIANQEQMPLVMGQAFWGIALSASALLAIMAWQRKQPQLMPSLYAIGAVLCIAGWMVGGASSASLYRHDLHALQQIQSQNPLQRWVAVGVLEPSWIYYTGHSIPEIPIAPPSPTENGSEGSSYWLGEVIARWEKDPQLGVITLSVWGDELEQHLRNLSGSELATYRLVREEYPYFLRHQPLCLIRLEPIAAERSQTAEKSPKNASEFRR